MSDDIEKGVLERLRHRESRSPVLIALAAGWFLTLGMRFVVPAILPQIKASFQIDNTTAGLAVTVIWAGYALTQFPAGVLVDRVGERALLTTSLTIAGGSVVGLGLARSVPLFLLACGLFGFGTGLYGPPRGTSLSRIFHDRQGFAFGVTLAAGSVGSALLPVVVTSLSNTIGWREAIGLVAPAFLMVSGVTWSIVPMRGLDSATERSALSTRVSNIKSAVRDRSLVKAIAGMMTILFTFQGLSAFLPLYLVEIKSFDRTTASTIFAVLFLSGAGFQLLVGWLSDRVGAKVILVSFAAIGGVTVGLIPFVNGLLPIIVLTVVLGSRMAFAPITNAYIITVLPDEIKGTTWGLIRTCFFLVGSTGSAVVGAFADRDLFDEAFFFLAAVTVVAGLCYAALPTNEFQTARE